MGNKIFGGVVLLLWGTTMTWLLTAKILPPFFDGEPPTLSVQSDFQPTAWTVALNGRPCGKAVMQGVRGTGGCTEIHSRLMIEQVPLPDVAPKWMSGLLSNLGEIDLDIRGWTTLDALENLATFYTRIQLNDVPTLIKMRGTVDDGTLKVTIKSGNFSKTSEHPWSDHQLIGGDLMPDSRLGNLRVGMKWHEETYSLFGSPSSPISMLEAEVVAREKMLFDDKLTPMHRIVYRSVAVSGVAATDLTRAEVWVLDDGRVARKEVKFLNARLLFERMPDDASQALADKSLDLERYATVAPTPRLAGSPQQPAPAP